MWSPPAGTRQTVSEMKWACLATPLLLLVVLVEARQVEVEDVTARQLEAATQTEDVLAVFWCKYNVKKAFRCFRPQPGCHLPNSPSAGIMTTYINYSRLGRVWQVTSWLGTGISKSEKLFLQCILYCTS
jgi:hypothetical protein